MPRVPARLAPMQEPPTSSAQRRAARFVWGTALGAALLAAPLLIGAAIMMSFTTVSIPQEGLLPDAVLAAWTALAIGAQVRLHRQRRRWVREDRPGLARRIEDQLPVALALACLMPWLGSLSYVLGGMVWYQGSEGVAAVVAVFGMPLLAPLLVVGLVPRSRWFPLDLDPVPTLNPVAR
jgi:hypothetical protein